MQRSAGLRKLPTRGRLAGLVFGGLVAWAQVAGAQLGEASVPVPPLRSPVTDLTGTLSPEQIGALEAKIRTFEAEKGSQVAVLIVPTTQPETIEQFSIRVVEAWKLGRKGIDDGALLLVAKNDRAVRIEVGYGLEGAVPDAIARRIVDEGIVPAFKRGQFQEGIDTGVDRLIGVIRGEPLPAPARSAGRSSSNRSEHFFTLLVIGIFLSGLLRSLFGRVAGSATTGVTLGIVAWMLFGTVVFAGLVAVGMFLLSLLGGGRGTRSWYSGGGRGGGGGGFGGGGGGFGGGGGRSGGGWSGGGGGFGGGGASGRW